MEKGIRNGKGKEYNEICELYFEGECLNGKKHGKGELHYNGKLFSENEYLYGNLWNGKGYEINAKYQYKLEDGDGSMDEYKYDSKRECYYRNDIQGEFLNGQKNRKWTLYKEFNLLIYEFEYLNGKKMEKLKNIINIVF